MMAAPMALVVRDNPPAGRFEAFYGDDAPAGHVIYRKVGLLMILLEVATGPTHDGPEALDEMLSAVCDELDASGLWMLPACQAVAEFLQGHPERGSIAWDRPSFPPTSQESSADEPYESGYRPSRSLLADKRDEEFPDSLEQAAPGPPPPTPSPPEPRPRRPRSRAVGDSVPPAEKPPARRQWPRPLFIGTVALGAVIVFSTILALTLLPAQPSDSVWTPILQDVIKTAFQALAVGALGGLTKLLIDRRKADEAKSAELRDRQRRYIDILVGVSHDVDNARSLLLANRSVRTWTDVVTGAIVPAKTRLRDIEHDLTNWEEAGVTLFHDRNDLDNKLDTLVTYLSELIEEHADNKQPLAENQRAAEAEKGHARLQQLKDIWESLERLPRLGDLIRGGGDYGAFRQNYLEALTLMRSGLRPVQELWSILCPVLACCLRDWWSLPQCIL
jgi:hypothetical protein